MVNVTNVLGLISYLRCEALETVPNIKYYKWITQDNHVRKVMQEDAGENVAATLEDLMCGKIMRTHMYNIHRQYSELKYLKKNLKEDEVILSVDFSKNYENKQRHEIQSAYFGHENFTIFTAACYFHLINKIEGKIDEDCNLIVVPVAIISNETSHDRDVAFSNNNELVSLVRNICPKIKGFHFWSDGCAAQFRSRFVFRSFLYYPEDITLTWNYGEAHHFKGPHDGIGGTIKRRVYREVKTGRLVLENAKQFAAEAGNLCNIRVFYLDAEEVQKPDLSDNIYTLGTLKGHHVNRVDNTTVELYLNSPFKQDAELLATLSWKNSPCCDDTFDTEPEENRPSKENIPAILKSVPLDMSDVREGMWVTVFYEDEKFIGKVMKVINIQAQVRCLEKPLSINKPQEFECEEDAVFYEQVYETTLKPENVKIGRKWLWKY